MKTLSSDFFLVKSKLTSESTPEIHRSGDLEFVLEMDVVLDQSLKDEYTAREIINRV